MGGIEERSGLGSTGIAEDTTTFPAVMTSLKERKGYTTVEVVAVGSNCVGLK